MGGEAGGEAFEGIRGHRHMRARPGGARSSREMLAKDLEGDPEFRREWERTKLARAVALVVVAYRARHGLSQRKLAERLGWKPSQVARLELGEHTPTFETLIFLAQQLGLRLSVTVLPAGRRRVGRGEVVHERSADGSRLRVEIGAV